MVFQAGSGSPWDQGGPSPGSPDHHGTHHHRALSAGVTSAWVDHHQSPARPIIITCGHLFGANTCIGAASNNKFGLQPAMPPRCRHLISKPASFLPAPPFPAPAHGTRAGHRRHKPRAGSPSQAVCAASLTSALPRHLIIRHSSPLARPAFIHSARPGRRHHVRRNLVGFFDFIGFSSDFGFKSQRQRASSGILASGLLASGHRVLHQLRFFTSGSSSASARLLLRHL